MNNKILIVIACALSYIPAIGQVDTTYTNGINRALNFYHAAQYRESAVAFSHTFAAYGAGYNDDRYTAACSWALAGNKDSAFCQLEHIAKKGNFSNTDRLLIDDDLKSLHGDPRWNKMFARVKRNKDKAAIGKR